MTEPEKNHWLSLASLLGARSSTPSPSAKSELAAKKAAAAAPPPAVVPPVSVVSQASAVSKATAASATPSLPTGATSGKAAASAASSLSDPKPDARAKGGLSNKPKSPQRHWHNLASALGLEVPSPPPETDPIEAELVENVAPDRSTGAPGLRGESEFESRSSVPSEPVPSESSAPKDVGRSAQGYGEPSSARDNSGPPRGDRSRDDRHSRRGRGGNRSRSDGRPPRDVRGQGDRPQGSSDRAPVSQERSLQNTQGMQGSQNTEAAASNVPLDKPGSDVGRDSAQEFGRSRDQSGKSSDERGAQPSGSGAQRRGRDGRGSDSRGGSGGRGGSGRGGARPHGGGGRGRPERTRDEEVPSEAPRMNSGDDEIVWTVWSEEGDAANLDELAAIDFGSPSYDDRPVASHDFDSDDQLESSDQDVSDDDLSDDDSIGSSSGELGNGPGSSERGPSRTGSRRRRRRRRGGSGGRDRDAVAGDPDAPPRESSSSPPRPAGPNRGSNQGGHHSRSDQRGKPEHRSRPDHRSRTDHKPIFESSGYGSDSEFDVVDDLDDDLENDLEQGLDRDLANDLDNDLDNDFSDADSIGGGHPLDDDDDELGDQEEFHRTVRPQVPSWTDTMDLIVNSNIEAHRNSPASRRGGPPGGGRRGPSSGGGSRGPSGPGPSGSGGRDGNRRGRRR